METEAIERIFESATHTKSTLIEQWVTDEPDRAVILRNAKKQTLLHLAAGYGRKNLVKLLIDYGSDPNAQDIDGQSPLHNACCHGHYSTAKTLINAGADVNLANNRGWTAIHFALNRKENANQITPLYKKVVDLLLFSHANPYHQTDSGRDSFARIKDETQRREVRIIHLLKKLDTCADECDVVRTDVIDRYLRIKDYFELVKTGNAEESIKFIKLFTTPNLLKSRLRNCDDITPLHRAAGYNHSEIAKFFIHEGADVNATDSEGRTPLHNAAKYGHVEMIELLVESGSDINRQDKMGQSPLHLAVQLNTHHACLRLIELNANIYCRDQDQRLPHDLACSEEVKEVLRSYDARRHQVIPSSSGNAIYIEIQPNPETTDLYSSPSDGLMWDSNNTDPLLPDSDRKIKKVRLVESDIRYQKVKRKMMQTIVTHSGEVGGRFSTYEIISIEQLYNELAWIKYKYTCRKLEVENGKGNLNERMLFHGSRNVTGIEVAGFDERHAESRGMFGAGIYFAKHSSKSNQYAFGFGQGCPDHNDKSCYICERKMIYAQVALGKSLVPKEARPEFSHAPPGHRSVIANPDVTDSLTHPEYVIYQGDQAYPLFIITYKIKP